MNRLDTLLALLKDEPDDVFLNYAVGIEYVASGQTDLAAIQFTRVLQIDNNYIAAYYQLGQLYTTRQDTGKAIQYYRQGLEKALAKKDNKAINEFNEALFLLED